MIISRNKGLTLTEVMLAITIVAMVMVAIIGLGMQAIQETGVAKDRTRASEFAQQAIEIVRRNSVDCAVDPCKYIISDTIRGTTTKLNASCNSTTPDNNTPVFENILDSGGSDTGFVRAINVRRLTAGDSAMVAGVTNITEYSLATVTVENNNTNPRKKVSVTIMAVIPPASI